MKTLLTILLLAMSSAPAVVKPTAETIAAGPLRISREGQGLIIYSETGGVGYYNRALKNVTWPGGASGCTWGIGYDGGYNTKAQIAEDWAHLGPERVRALQSVAGLKGQAARSALPQVRPIVVTWDEAMQVYQKSTMPRFGKMTDQAFPKLTTLSPDCQAAMLSIVFNRGAAMGGGSRLEMRQSRDAIAAGKPSPVPRYILDMRRLWIGKGLDGLLTRRQKEAALFQRGLTN
jgi:hypothetical protein